MKRKKLNNQVSTVKKKKCVSFSKSGSSSKKLADKDPEFYKYLQENDPDLLNFSYSSEGEDVSGTEEEVEHTLGKRKEVIKGQSNDKTMSETVNDSISDGKVKLEKKVLYLKEVNYLIRRAFEEHSFFALKEFIRIFKDICHISEPVDCYYTINDPAVFKKVLTFTLDHVCSSFDYHLCISNSEKKNPTISKKWHKCKTVIKSFLSNLLHLLKTNCEPTILAFILRRIPLYLTYYLCFPKLQRVLVKFVFYFPGILY